MPIKEKELNYYQTFTNFLIKYEQTNLKKADPATQKKMSLVSDPSKLDIKEKLEYLSTNASNPFKHIKNWVKGEILELESILEAISMKEAMVSRKHKTESKMKNNRNDVDKIASGKFTVKGLFKNKEGKANS